MSKDSQSLISHLTKDLPRPSAPTKINPLVSVVTVTLNAQKTIKSTLQSIAEQTFTNLEHIIIDGDSTDRTKEILLQSEAKIILISEKDQGIFDAMNKGISLCKGEWIIFLNAGDRFASTQTLQKIFSVQICESVDLIYGDIQVQYPDFYRVKKASPLQSFPWKMPFSHQAVLTRKKLLFAGFDLSWGNCCDFHFLYHCWMDKKKFLYLDEVISVILPDGVSDQSRIANLLTRWKICGFKDPFLNLYYLVKIPFWFLKLRIKNFLPKRMVLFYLRYLKS